MWTWLITRPVEESEALVQELGKHGVPARALPCVERRALTLAPWNRLGGGLIFLTSAAAVHPVMASLPLLSVPGPPTFAAVAPSTLRALEAAGGRADVVSVGGAVELATQVSRWLEGASPRLSVLYPTSDQSSDEQREAIGMLERVADVQRVVAYQTTAPAGLRASLSTLLTSDFGVFFSSPSAVRHFAAALPAPGAVPRQVACFGRSTLTEAKRQLPAGWPSPTLLPGGQALSLSLDALWRQNGGHHG